MAHFYIAGIHTDAGKTHFSALFCRAFSYAYFKLIQAGAPHDSDFIKRFVPECENFGSGITLQTPTSPHIAKHIENRCYASLDIIIPQTENLLIELAGGLFSPIDERWCMIDYIQKHPKPCVLVGRYYVGCINHILLSVQALRVRGMPPVCVVLMADELDSSTLIESTPQSALEAALESNKLDSTSTHSILTDDFHTSAAIIADTFSHNDAIDTFLRQHALLEGIPLYRSHFFTQESFSYHATILESTLRDLV